MSIATDQQDKYALITLSVDKLNTLNAPDVKAEFVEITNAGTRNIIIDLSAVSFVDSSGLSAILTASRLCKNLKGTIVLSGLNDNVLKLINISQLDNILHIVPTNKEAIDLVLMHEIEQEIKGDE